MLGSLFDAVKGGISVIPGAEATGPIQEIVAGLLTGSITAAVGVGAAYALSLPGARHAVGGVCFAGGKFVSIFFVRWFGTKLAGKIERRLQDFLKNTVIDNFMRGLDFDDHLNK